MHPKLPKQLGELRAANSRAIDGRTRDLVAPPPRHGGAPLTSHSGRVTSAAREQHAAPRARCVITAPPLAAAAAPPPPIGRRRTLAAYGECLGRRPSAKRFIRLPLAKRPTRPAAETRILHTLYSHTL
ncbi:hypothetical protein JYU34_002882 [Plutella xylostella]|uniref:Uncharacterized protein n=1 Tax=Plutella xylostella TaxID=51655 RepID=A0ABQ7R3C9_PLUXY|nr:hypothetical protein JYU34_002882 [Plutella xylostella]